MFKNIIEKKILTLTISKVWGSSGSTTFVSHGHGKTVWDFLFPGTTLSETSCKCVA